MATFAVIDQSNAPAPPIPQSDHQKTQMRLYEGYVRNLKARQAGRLAPAPAETPRGLAVRVTRAARRLGKEVETWTADGAVYFVVR